jgi:hypothetical protein
MESPQHLVRSFQLQGSSSGRADAELPELEHIVQAKAGFFLNALTERCFAAPSISPRLIASVNASGHA